MTISPQNIGIPVGGAVIQFPGGSRDRYFLSLQGFSNSADVNQWRPGVMNGGTCVYN